MIELYFAPGTVARAVLITLHELELAYQGHKIDFASSEQTGAEFHRVNPKGRVPALVTDRGILTEAAAILVYLAQIHPSADLLPLDSFDLARMQSFNSYLGSTVHINHAHRFRGKRWVDSDASIADMQAKVPQTMLESCRLIEDDLLQGPWVMGEQYTVADAYLYTVACWLEGDGVDMAQLPRIADHLERMNQRPAVIAALQAEQA